MSKTYTASVFGGPADPGTGSTGYRGKNLASGGGMYFAELSNDYQNGTGADFKALGGLKKGTKVRVTYKGRSVVLTKADVGAGGPGMGGHKRGIDIWYQAAQKLGLNGLGNVQVEVLDGSHKGETTTTQMNGGTQPAAQGASMADIAAQALLNRSKSKNGSGSLLKQMVYLKSLQPDAPAKEAETIRGVTKAAGEAANTSLKGTAMFEGHRVAAWIAPALEYARKHGWKGQVNSGFRSYADQTRIYNSGVRPAAKPGTSNHEGSQYPRGAVDVSDAAQLSKILLNSPWRKQLIYAGSKDPVHFSHPHGGSY